MRHGPDLEEMGGTNIDRVNSKWILPRKNCASLTVGFVAEPTKTFLDHFMEEIKEQFRSSKK